MLIDFHHHLPLNPPCPYTEHYLEAIEEITEQFGIDYICINALGSGYRNRSNEECLELAGKCRRVLPFAYFEMDSATAETINKAIDEGFRGLKFICPEKDYDDLSYMPLYEAAAGHNMPCLFHTGFVGRTVNDAGLRVSSARMRPVFLDTIARRFPELPIVAAHLGSPWVEEAVSTMVFNPNVYFDLSGIVDSLNADFFRRFWIGGFNWDKIIFGSDCMIRDFHIPYNAYQRLLSQLEVPKSTQDAVFGKTAARLLGLENP